MIHYIRASGLHGLAEYAATLGLDLQEMLQAADLPRNALDNPDNLIAYSKLIKLLEIGTLRSGDPLFALQLGLRQNIARTIGPLLYLVRNAATVGDALVELCSYFHIHTSSGRVRLEVQGEHALLHYDHTVQEDAVKQSAVVELVVGGAQQLMRVLLGSRWQPYTLMLQHAPSREPQAYSRLIGLTPQFNSPHNAWVFDARLLALPLSSADQELHRVIRQHLDSLEQITIEALPDHVYQIVCNFLPHGRVTVERVADYLALSTRTLQRHLAAENTTFQQLLDQARQAVASRYLSDSTISLTQLADLLGYSELSAFSRAFQRWFGVSPRKWKNTQDAAPQRRIRLRRR